MMVGWRVVVMLLLWSVIVGRLVGLVVGRSVGRLCSRLVGLVVDNTGSVSVDLVVSKI